MIDETVRTYPAWQTTSIMRNDGHGPVGMKLMGAQKARKKGGFRFESARVRAARSGSEKSSSRKRFGRLPATRIRQPHVGPRRHATPESDARSSAAAFPAREPPDLAEVPKRYSSMRLHTGNRLEADRTGKEDDHLSAALALGAFYPSTPELDLRLGSRRSLRR